MAAVKCPSCNRQLEVEEEYRDWTVRCPHCEHEFVPDDVREAEARSDDRPRRPRRDEDDYDRDDRDERDRDDRGRSDRDDEDDRYGEPEGVREEALRLVAAPALWLEICGWVTALGAVGLTVALLLFAAEVANNPQANQNGD